MQFGLTITPHIERWELIRYAEELGYDRAWVPDSQMIWSDCYATLALAAHHTSRIELGTGVAITGTRIAPVTAHSIASIAALAPGRTFLGLGTGHTAMRVMGQDPMRVKAFREYLRVVRTLLDGEAVDTEVQRWRVRTALRDGRPLDDPKLETLRSFATQVVRERGWVGEGAIGKLLAAGYTRRTVFEVILAASFKTLSNYTDHVTDAPVDTHFQDWLWQKPEAAE